MSDSALDTPRKAICEGLISLHEQSQTDSGLASILSYALGACMVRGGLPVNRQERDMYCRVYKPQNRPGGALPTQNYPLAQQNDFT